MLSDIISEIIEGVSNTCKVFGDYFTSLFYTDDNNVSFLGSILLIICSISFCLLFVIKLFKIFNVRCKNSDVVDKLSNEKNTDDFEKNEDLEHEYHCLYCGSITSSNKHNCRNCGSDEFKKG